MHTLSFFPALRRLVPGCLFLLLIAAGCGRFSPHPAREYVYVWTKEGYLIDRVSVVNNRVAEVSNGERLQVLDHGQRFLRVKTPKGEIGWIEEHGVIDQKTYDQFLQMQKDHAGDPVIAHGILLEDYWLRDAPGRKSDRYYLLPENAKVDLLLRASVPRPVVRQPLPLSAAKKDNGQPPPPPPMEDYWLVRDAAGQVGWVRSHVIDETMPDAIAGLGEGQKMVAAWVLRTVYDSESTLPDHQVPEYLAVLAPWKDGLPYDFDQVRVFTWNVRKHRYETAYRERNIAGFLPVTISHQTFGKDEEPVFSWRVALGDTPSIDPTTGLVRPGPTATETYRMEGVLVRHIDGPPADSIDHPNKQLFSRGKGRHRRR